MDMDKDVASAIVLERCNCYDGALEAAKRALLEKELPPDQLQATRDVVKSLGALYYKQHCLEKILECYHLLQGIADNTESETYSQDEKVEIRAGLHKDYYEIFNTLERLPENQGKTQDLLLREAVTLLILKYSESQDIKNIVLEKARKVFS